MGNFGMELHSVLRLRFVCYPCKGGMLGLSDRAKVLRQLRKSISMAHICLERVSQALKEPVYVSTMAIWNYGGLPILSLCTGYDVGIGESIRNGLKTVTDSQDRSVRKFEKSRVKFWCVFFVDGIRATGQDDAFWLETESIQFCGTWEDFGKYVKLDSSHQLQPTAQLGFVKPLSSDDKSGECFEILED